METHGYNATGEYLASLNLGKSKDKVLDAGVEWKDPMRMFEEVGKKVPEFIRFWLLLTPEERLKNVEKYNFTRDKETESVWQNRLDTRWRDLSFVISEELKTFVRPELDGRGSPEVVNAAIRLLIPPMSKRLK